MEEEEMHQKFIGRQHHNILLFIGRCILLVLLVGLVSACRTALQSATSTAAKPSTAAIPRQPPGLARATLGPPSVSPRILPGDWPSFLLGKGGLNTSETAITPRTAHTLTRIWTAHAGGGISSEPIVVNNTVFWGSWDGYEHATSVTGQLRWSTFLGKSSSAQCYPPVAGVASTPTVMPITIKGTTTLVDFVGGGNARFYALNAATGAVLWSTSLGSAYGTFIWDSPVIFQGHMYIGTASVGECPGTRGQFFQLDASTGAIDKTLDLVPDGCLGGGVWGSPTLDTTTGTIYITTSNASTCGQQEPYAMSVIELRASSMTITGSWRVPPSQAVADGDFGATPVLFTARANGVSRALVGVVNKNGYFYAFQRDNIGAGPLWYDRISSSPVAKCDICPSGDESAAAWDGSRLYVGSTSTTINGNFCYGSVRALDPATGDYLWQDCLSAAYRVMAPLILVPGLVVVGAGPGFSVLDTGRGTTLFSYHDPDKNSTFDGAATIAHGVLYIGNLDGTLSAFVPSA